MIKPIEIINKYYYFNPFLKKILLIHSENVKKKALEIAKKVPELNPNLKIIEIGSMLHDIGIIKTYMGKLNPNKKKPYILHGIEGAKILDKEIKGNEKEIYKNICKNHIGVGISKEDIIKENLPLPNKDFIPKTIEEEIITLADKFYSKNPKTINKEESIEEIRKELEKYGNDKVKKFDQLLKKYKII